MDMFTDTSVCWENKKLFSMVFTHRILKPIENGGQSSKCPLLSLFICVCMCVHMWEDRMTASGAILRNDIHLLQDRACPDWSPFIRLTSLAIWDPMASSYPALVSLAQGHHTQHFHTDSNNTAQSLMLLKGASADLSLQPSFHILLAWVVHKWCWYRWVYSPGWHLTHCVAQASFECSMILLSHSTKC